jgi:hypothetical protein
MEQMFENEGRFIELPLDDNIELYRDYYDRALSKTVYHHPDYLLAEEKAEGYRTYLYILENEENFVILPSVKRRINDIEVFQNLTGEYYDLKTPHEYSGVIAGKYDESDIACFYKELEAFCKDNNIVFSFIRFNPYRNENELAVNYVIKKSDEQVWIGSDENLEPRVLSKSMERNLKIALKHGFSCEKVEKNSDNIKIFERLYVKAMDRLQAKNFFYFNEKYFEKILNASFSQLYFVYDKKKENVLSATIILLDEFNKKAYYHLSCRDSDNHIRGSMELLISTFSARLKEEGYSCIHLGGGATENLKEFKARFSDKRIDYFIGYKVFDIEKYRYLCDMFCEKYPEMKESNFLPLYRSKE